MRKNEKRSRLTTLKGEACSGGGEGIYRYTPEDLTWTIMMEAWKIMFLSKWVIVSSMLIFQGVSCSAGNQVSIQLTSESIGLSHGDNSAWQKSCCYLTLSQQPVLRSPYGHFKRNLLQLRLFFSVNIM